MSHIKQSAEQLFFPGFDRAPEDRLFFAVFPDAPAVERVRGIAESLRGKFELRGRALAPKRFHVTLHHVGDYAGLPDDVVARAREAASALSQTSFDVMFDRAGSFMGRRRDLPLVLRGGNSVIPLMAFQHALGEAMKRVKLGRWVASGYTPHVTLLYDARYVAAQSVEPVAWTVREFVLVHSLLGRTRHIALARWPLSG